MNEQQPARVIVVGAGHVGATFAYALLLELPLASVLREALDGLDPAIGPRGRSGRGASAHPLGADDE